MKQELGQKQMKIFLFFFLLTVFAVTEAKAYTLAVPKDRAGHLFMQMKEELERIGYVQGKNLSIIEIDLSKATTEREALKKRIESEVDLFFLMGHRVNILLQTVKPQVPILFIGVKGAHPFPDDMKPYATGIYRTLTIEKLFERIGRILPKGRRLAFLFKRNSGLQQLASKFQKMSAKVGIDLVATPYDRPGEFDALFGRLKGEVGGVVLFPPSVKEKDFPMLLRAQFKHRLPVLAQTRENIKAGALGGPTINYTYSVKKLANYADRIFRGESPADLPIYFDRTRFCVNLATASRLGVEIPEEVASQADILGISETAVVSDEKAAPLKAGAYTVAIPANAYSEFVKSIMDKLAAKGYEKGKNLTILRFDRANAAPKADLILSPGNILSQVVENNPSQKIVALSIHNENLKQQIVDKEVYVVFRSSAARLVEMVTQLSTKKNIGLFYHRDSMMDESRNLRSITAALEELEVTIDQRSYGETDELQGIMEEWKEKRVDLALLFPPSLERDADIKAMVELQERLKLPVIAQTECEVRAGLALGILIDTDVMYEQVAVMCDHLFQKKEETLSKTVYLKANYLINLQAIQRLGLEVPRSISANAKLVY